MASEEDTAVKHNCWSHCKAGDDNIQTDVAVLDFPKAFEFMTHERLLRKLNSMALMKTSRDGFAAASNPGSN